MFLKDYNSVFAKWLKTKNPHYECVASVAHIFYGLLKESIPSLSQTPPVWIPNSHQSRTREEAVFSRLLDDLTISAPTSTPQAFLFSCSTVSLYKASHKMGLGTLLAKNAPVLWDIPEVSQNEATGVLRMLTRPWELWRLTQGSRTDVPWMPAVLLYDPTPLGSCQHHSGHSFWLEIVPYCERPHWYERNIFIKRSIGNLLGKLWTCSMCMLQVFLPQIYFLTFL